MKSGFALAAVQVQLLALGVTVNVPVVPFGSAWTLMGLRVKVQAALWVTWKSWVPTEMVPVRAAFPGFAVALYVTVPLPVADPETLSHG
jgi:hypothetical protein